MRRLHLAASLMLGLLLAGCAADESLKPPPPPPVPTGGAMFQTYVSLGNSITAGFQSAGIDDSTQRRSYAPLLAAAMGTQFSYPSLLGRGCPPPFTNNVTQARVGGGTGGTCDLVAASTAPFHNLAVPGARAEELLNNFGVPFSNSNALTLLFLGGATQVQRMAEEKPTFVSLWIGNNDVLGSLISLSNPGNPQLVTPLATFQQQFDSLTDSIAAVGAKAVLVGVADVSVIPYASRGATYWCIKNQPACGTFPAAFPPTFTVSNNCAPAAAIPGAKGDSTLVPWPIWIPMLQAALGGQPENLDCSVDNLVVTAAEFATLRTAVTGFNAHIQSVATAHGWAYWDPNPTLYAQLQGPANPTGLIPPFPDLSQALTGGSVLFGPLFTLDGVHPSALTHEIVADSLASTINAVYGTTLPVPVCGTVTCPAP